MYDCKQLHDDDFYNLYFYGNILRWLNEEKRQWLGRRENEEFISNFGH
jgi:hypothetical protein